MKKFLMFVLATLFISPLMFGTVDAQQADICRLFVEWAPPGFYADDQCTDIGTDPINQTEQDLLWYVFKAKPTGEAEWTIITDGPDTSASYSGLPCSGTYDVEILTHFEGQAADCPAVATKTLTAPRPGSCTILP